MATNKWFRQQILKAEKSFDFRLESLLIEIGEDIAFLMEQQGLTRSQLAERLGVSRAYVTKILNGNPNLTIKTILKLADVLAQDLEINFKIKREILAQQSAALPKTTLCSMEDLFELELLEQIAEPLVESKSETKNSGFALIGAINDCNLAA